MAFLAPFVPRRKAGPPSISDRVSPTTTPTAVTKPPPAKKRSKRRYRQPNPARPDPVIWSAQPHPPAPPDLPSLPDLPANITAHEVLTPVEENSLLQTVRFLQDERDAHDGYMETHGEPPTDQQLAAALSLSPTSLTETRANALRARNHLVSANLRLARSIACSIHRSMPAPRSTARGRAPAARAGAVASGVSRSDLLQEGSIALIRAAECYDVTLGRSRFSTYAARAVWTACARAAQPALCAVSVPQRVRVAARRLRALRAGLEREGRELPRGAAGDAMLAEALGGGAPSPRLVRLGDRHLTSGVSLDDDVRGTQTMHDGFVRRGELVEAGGEGPESFAEWQLVRECLLAACVRRLSKRDASIVMLRFGLVLEDDKQLLVREIAQRYELSAARVTQIVRKGLRILRETEPELAELLDCL